MQTRSHFAALLVMALAIDAGPAVAQDVTIVPKLRAGQEFQLEVIRTRENSSRSQQNGKARTLVDVRVLSAGPDGFVIDGYPATDARQSAGGTGSDRRRRFTALRDITFRLNLNVDGELTGVANQAEVAPKLKAVVDAIVLELSARVPDAQRKQFLDFMGQVLSADVLIASATRDAGTYFGLNGVSLASSEAVEIDIEQPNPLGGAALPANSWCAWTRSPPIPHR